jgi:hypothetical protein
MKICGGGSYSMVRCCGCDDIHYLSETWFSEDTDEYGRPNIDAKRYPPAMTRRHPEWLNDWLSPLPGDIRDLLQEIYISLHNNNLRLCALGIRALVEQLILTKISDTGKLGKNITAFFEAGYVAPKDQDQFRDKVIEVGNAAMHRAYTPVYDDIGTLLDITEVLIATIFVHPERARELGKGMPTRPPSKSPSAMSLISPPSGSAKVS